MADNHWSIDPGPRCCSLLRCASLGEKVLGSHRCPLRCTPVRCTIQIGVQFLHLGNMRAANFWCHTCLPHTSRLVSYTSAAVIIVMYGQKAPFFAWEKSGRRCQVLWASKCAVLCMPVPWCRRRPVLECRLSVGVQAAVSALDKGLIRSLCPHTIRHRLKLGRRLSRAD